MRCDDVAPQLADAAAGTALLDGDARHHVGECLRCQADMVQYRRLLRALRALRTEVLEPAPGQVADVLVAVAAAGEQRAVDGLLRGRRGVYVGGLAAAATAAAGGALVLASRSRRRVRIAS
jgi:hypothetical protein